MILVRLIGLPWIWWVWNLYNA